MSNAALAYVVRGVKVAFELVPCEIKLNRFDPKTGVPVLLATRSYSITATCGESQVTLPDDTLAFEEERPRYESLETWIWTRAKHRIYEWFHGYGIHEDATFQRFLHWNYHPNEEVVGVCIANDSTNGSTGPLPVEIDINKMSDITEALNDVISSMFGKPCPTSLYLIARLI